MRRFLATLLAVLLSCPAALAADPANGKRLFYDPALGGGTSGKCCFTCHEGGRGLGDDLDRRKEFTVMGNRVADLAGVVNFCIEVALRGEGLARESREMEDLTGYLVWLGRNPSPVQPEERCGTPRP